MATLTKGKTFANGELVTPQKLHELVDLGTVSGIVNADISATAAIADTKLAQITTANKVAQSAVANLTTDLAGKAAASHTHAATDITSGTLSNARTTATSANTANAIVARDASGNFSAGEISAYTFKARGGPANNPTGPSENGYAFTSPGDNNSGMFSSANGQIEFLINNNEIARLTTSDFLVGTTSQIAVGTDSIDGVLISHFDPRIIVSRNNLPSMECRRRSSNGEIVNFYRDTTKVGNISVTATSTAYNTSSDYRLKTNLEPLTDAVARLLQIPVHRFNWLADPNGQKVDGFLAHEAQAVVPESVTGRKDEVDAEGNPIHQNIDQSKLVPLLFAAVQELAARVAALEAR